MKSKIILIIGLLLIYHSIADCKEAEKSNTHPLDDSINVFTIPDIYDLTMKWTSEYTNLYPSVKIKVISTSVGDFKRLLSNGTGIGFIDEKSNASLKNQELWNVEVGHDLIVPVMNAANPFKKEICRKGITSEGFAEIFQNNENQNWGKLLDNPKNIPLHFYLTNESSVLNRFANFTQTNQIMNNGSKVVSGDELIAAIIKDPNALGFCKLAQIIDPNKQDLIENIILVPIDKNGNGRIDYVESIYDNLQSFKRGVWIGKYPNALSGNIYSVSSKRPNNIAEVAFLKWVLTDGQKYLSTNGYSDLVFSERQTQLKQFDGSDKYTSAPKNSTYSAFKILILLIITIVVIGLLLDLAFSRSSIKRVNVNHTPKFSTTVFDEESVIIPKGLYFDKTHTWAFMKKDGSVKIGIDDFLQHITGKITRIEMKNISDEIKKGEKLLTLIHNGKQLNIYSPVSGTITEKNSNLITNSALINSAPYSEGWVYMIEPANWSREIQFLSMAEKYKTWLIEEFSRLKDFFASVGRKNVPEYAFVAMQDGGSLKDCILADLGPETWEEFQTKFLDRI